MGEVVFDAMQYALPQAPRGTRLKSLAFTTCPGSDLRINLVRENAGEHDEFGIVRDAWWRIVTGGLPDRTFRTTRGSHSVRNLLRRYGFLDTSGCVNHKQARASYGPRTTPLAELPPDVPSHLLDATGVPQFYANSGVCWLTATFWNAFANPAVRDLLRSRMPDDMRPLCDRCLYERDVAEALRKKLWYSFAMGDNVEDSPLKDGRNGFSEFCTLCAKLRVPMVRLKEEDGKFYKMSQTVTDRRGASVTLPLPRPGAPHLLALRFIDGDHRKFPLYRTMHVRGVPYRLTGMWCGHKKCGHQLGIACVDEVGERNAISDADMHKDGIGPIYVNFKNYGGDWWWSYKHLLPVTKFSGGEFCNLSPHNDPDNALDRYRGASPRGSNSVDALYVYMS